MKKSKKIDVADHMKTMLDPSYEVDDSEEVEDLSDNPKFNDDPMSGEMDDMEVTMPDGRVTTFGAVRLETLAKKHGL